MEIVNIFFVPFISLYLFCSSGNEKKDDFKFNFRIFCVYGVFVSLTLLFTKLISHLIFFVKGKGLSSDSGIYTLVAACVATALPSMQKILLLIQDVIFIDVRPKNIEQVDLVQ